MLITLLQHTVDRDPHKYLWRGKLSGRQDRAVDPSGCGRAIWRRTITSCRNITISRPWSPGCDPQDQPAGHPDHDQVQQTERHEPRSFL